MNMDKQALSTALQRANQAFRKQEFALAIDLYRESSNAVPVLASSLQLNIELANRRLQANLLSNVSTSHDLIDLSSKTISISLTKPENLEDFYFDKIVDSGLFDTDYYMSVCQSYIGEQTNLLAHYLEVGADLGLNPSKYFDTTYYLKCNPDVAQSGMNPFIHYVCNGQAEGREALPKPYESRYVLEPIKYVEKLPEDSPVISKIVRVICFYLPQFHAIPENNKWWGEGFTEWTNVKPAIPQFQGHYQPHIPHSDLGYYNLLQRDVQAKQIELAKLYGIEGFCYYLYWFSGQRLLEQPLDNMLADPSLDLPFCVCWANENWSRRWDGLENDLLMVQEYSPSDDCAFISNVSKYLRDPRYIKIDGKPLLLVYRPNLFPDMKATAMRWRTWCKENGVGDIYLAYPQSFETVDPADYNFDAAIEFPPNNSNPPRITEQVTPQVDDFQTTVYDWRIFVERSDSYVDPGYKLFRSATPSWDNTARKKNKGTVFHNSSPQLFERYLTNAFNETLFRRENPSERIVFINAWNEWAEGAHLEPDERYGYAWLNAVRNTHIGVAKRRKRIVIVSHDAHPHGAQILCLNFAKTFSQQFYFDVDMIVLGQGILLEKYAQFASVHCIDLNNTNDLEMTGILSKIRAQGADVAIVNTTVSGKIIPYLKNADFKVVSLIHELPSILNNYGLQEHAALINKHADKVIFPAKQVQNGFEEFIGESVNFPVIRPQGIYLPSILRDGVDKGVVRASVRKTLGLDQESKIIMCAGYADFRKGFDYFLQSCLAVMESIPNVYALWVGHLDVDFVQREMKALDLNEFKDRFIFTGLVDDPREYYVAADIYALTSREDPFPSVVMEALDALTPVVAFRDSGGFENLLSRDCGILVEKNDIYSFGNALIDLLKDKDKSLKLASVGQSIVQREMSFYHYLFDLLEFAGSPIPKLSVVVPNYNYMKYIEERLNSIIGQKFPIYELIVLDDASTDNSVMVIQNILYKCKIPTRLIINERNSGSVFRQWEKAAEISVGEYIWIAEADDLADPNFAGTLMSAFEDPSVFLAYSQSKQIDQDGNVLAENYLEYTDDVGDFWTSDYCVSGEAEIERALCIKNTIPNVSASIMRKQNLKEFFEVNNNLSENFKVAGDWFVYIEMIKNNKIYYNAKSLNSHRRHIGSVTKVNSHLDEVVRLQSHAARGVLVSHHVQEKIEKWNLHLTKYFSGGN
jgi:glycosyltransferase involved in cell wall biosynthesis